MMLLAFGTRPEYIKLKPLINVLKQKSVKFKVVFTGQHPDLVDADSFDVQLKISEGANRLNSIVSSILNEEEIFSDVKSVLVQGDTASAYAFALSAFHKKIPIIHLEAGLRTYEETPFPEEFYRRSISLMSTVNLCPTANNIYNLSRERLNGSSYQVGNTVLDNLIGIETKYDSIVLVTLHRRENLDLMTHWFESLAKAADQNKHLTFVVPIHPNPEVRKKADSIHGVENINVVEPLSHKELIDVLRVCKFVITDSGGIQEEASFLKKKTIVCRNSTERQESLGRFSFICSFENLPSLVKQLDSNFVTNEKCPFGDGHSSERIYEILNELNFFK